MSRPPGKWAQVRANVAHRHNGWPIIIGTDAGRELADKTPLYAVDVLQLRATLVAAKNEVLKRGGSVAIAAIIDVALENL